MSNCEKSNNSDKAMEKVALITGATSGIGRATALLLSKKGYKTALVGRNMERGKEIENEINSSGGNSVFVKCDISKEDEVQNMVSKVLEIFQRIDVIFNNAGTMLPSMELERLPFEDWKNTFDINVNGYFLVIKYCKEQIFKNKGVIINNASIAGLQYYAAGRSYAYSASKAAIIQFSHQMAKNYAEEGVRVNCISPGIIETPILGDRDLTVYAERVPLKRVGTPDDVAKVVCFLASDDAAYLTGVNIPIDGGVSL